MLKHHLILFFRNSKRYKASFIINSVGLSTALACAILIGLWANDELAMDKFHEKDEQLFQVKEFLELPHETLTFEVTSGNIGPLLVQEMPEVLTTVQVARYPQNATLSTEDLMLKADGHYLSKDYFKTFSFPLVQGNADNIWDDTNSIVISESLANKLFGSPGLAMGKTVEFQRKDKFTVSGVFGDLPKQTSEKFDFALSYEEKTLSQPNLMDWGSQGSFVYLTLQPNIDITAFNVKIHDFIREQTGYPRVPRSPFVQRYSENYLYGTYEDGVQTGGRIEYVKLFSLIGLFILVIACINFMNLSTAKASRRLKEIGIKKVAGAKRNTLVYQYLMEAVLMSFLALLMALILVFLLLPEFNQLTGKELQLTFSPIFSLALLGVALFTGFLAGSYPALYLSGFKPVSILKGRVNGSNGEAWIRKGLVVAQYTASVVLIISVLVVHGQIEFVQNKNLGYEKAQVIHFDREGEFLDKDQMDTFLAELRNVPGVVAASSSRNKMTNQGWGVGGLEWDGKNPDDYTEFQNMIAYYGLIELLDIHLLDGRTYSEDFSAETTKVMFNQAAIDHMQLEDPVGKTIHFRGLEREIIGVVDNFHFESLHEDIKPMIINLWPDRLTKFMVKIQAGAERETLASMEKLYQAHNPGFLFDYTFLDNNYQELYEAEKRVSTLSGYFSILAIVISCLGLFGLVGYMSEQKKKEIGIRKVLGASISSVISLLTKDFVKLVVVAFVIASPIAYYFMQEWLGDFAYRITIKWWMFAVAGSFALTITLVTVSFQSIKSAMANPIKSLRTE